MKKMIWIFALALILLFGCAAAEITELPHSLKIIKEEAFCGDTAFEKVIVPEGVSAIESRAFADSGLEVIQLPDSLKTISDDAFDGCGDLVISASGSSYACQWAREKGFEVCEKINISGLGYTSATETDHLLTFFPLYNGGSDDLYFTYEIYRDGKLVHTEKAVNCKYFSFVPGIAGTYDCKVTIQDAYGFRNSTTIGGKIEIAAATPAPASDFEYEVWYDSVYIDEYVGSDTSVTIPRKIKNLPVQSMSLFDCDTIESLVLPNTLIGITELDYWCMSNVEGIYIPDGIKSIGSMAFCDLVSLKNIILPEKMTFIDDHAFWGCSDLNSIMLPQGMTKLGTEAFIDCYNLKSVYIPSSVTRINPDVFSGCSLLTCIVEEGSVAQQYCIDNNIDYVFPF